MNALVIFDGDDTLWPVEFLYDEARDAIGGLIAGSGVDPARWESIERQIDVENVPRLGLSAERFPTSCVEAYAIACAEAQIGPDPAMVEKIRRSAGEVFERRAEPYPAATAVLDSLHGRYRLALLSQGERWVQQKRIAESGLTGYFERIAIVPRKAVQSFKSMLDEVAVPAQFACSVGNSLPSDINPALACGMSAVWVPAEVWDFERRETSALTGQIRLAEDLAAVPRLIDDLLGRAVAMDATAWHRS